MSQKMTKLAIQKTSMRIKSLNYTFSETKK